MQYDGITETAVRRALDTFRTLDLRSLLPAGKPAGWSLDLDTLRFLVSLVDQLQPQHVLEFGSGLSTDVLAWACARTESGCRITSIDPDPEFIEPSRARASLHDREGRVSFVFAPLVARELGGGKTVPVYHLPPDSIAATGPADLILIDGPPKALGGREGVLYQAMAFARPGTLMLLDDANRAAEKSAVLEWQKRFGDAIRVWWLPGFAKGLVAITVVEALQKEGLMRHQDRLVAEALSSQLRPGTEWIVVDDGTSDLRAFAGCRCLPFLEHDGEYWGRPATDEQAIDELERLRRAGASHLAFLANAFWWLDHYARFRAHLERSFACTVRDERLVVFDLRNPPPSTAAPR
jgi:predicted O-methyltransferase YrrM